MLWASHWIHSCSASTLKAANHRDPFEVGGWGSWFISMIPTWLENNIRRRCRSLSPSLSYPKPILSSSFYFSVVTQEVKSLSLHLYYKSIHALLHHIQHITITVGLWCWWCINKPNLCMSILKTERRIISSKHECILNILLTLTVKVLGQSLCHLWHGPIVKYKASRVSNMSSERWSFEYENIWVDRLRWVFLEVEWYKEGHSKVTLAEWPCRSLDFGDDGCSHWNLDIVFIFTLDITKQSFESCTAGHCICICLHMCSYPNTYKGWEKIVCLSE